MLLRRITKHVTDQNWFAVFIDFLIVVTGVFIGIQVANWNETKSDRHDYELALDRFHTETQANITTMNALENEVTGHLGIVRKAFDALRSCEDNPENRIVIEKGLSTIKGTSGIQLRMNALNELTQVQPLLAQQSDAERERLSEIKFLLELMLHESRFSEERPHQDTVQSSKAVGYGELEFNEWQYLGLDTSAYERDLLLSEPANIACKDYDLLRSFYSWERAQGYLPLYTKLISTKLEEYLAGSQ